MKPLEQLDNVAKGKMLHELFPGEIPALLDYVLNAAVTIIEDKDNLREEWKDGLFTFAKWLEIVTDVKDQIERQGDMRKRSGVFADHLFDGYNAVFMIYCLNLYIKTRKQSNQRLLQGIQLFFDL